jgi:hypothetical protein
MFQNVTKDTLLNLPLLPGVNSTKVSYCFFRFSLLSLSVCSIRKYCLYFRMAKLNSKNKKSSFYEEKKFGRIDFWNVTYYLNGLKMRLIMFVEYTWSQSYQTFFFVKQIFFFPIFCC